MTAELTYIAKTASLEPSENYAELRADGIEYLRELGRELWTDHNVHDPGITMLEHLCYGITELGYRTGYPIRDLLTTLENGGPVNDGDFHTAREILTCDPVSFDDLRKLLIDIRGVRNAWIDPHCDVRYFVDEAQEVLVDGPEAPGLTQNPAVSGLFDVYIEHEDGVLPEPRIRHIAGPEILAGSAFHGTGRGIRFHVAHDLTLGSVRVHPEAAGDVNVRWVDRRGEVLGRRSRAVSGAEAAVEEGVRIALDFAIPAGTDYRLEVAEGSVALQWTKEPSFPYGIDDVITLVGSSRGLRGTRTSFFCFFDWEIAYAVFPASEPSIPRLSSIAGPAFGPDDDGAFVATRRVRFIPLRSCRLDAVVIRAETGGEVEIRLGRATGEGPDRFTHSVDAGVATRVPLGFELTGGKSYRLMLPQSGIQLWGAPDAVQRESEPEILRVAQRGPAHNIFYDWEVSYPTQPATIDITGDDVRLAVRDRLHTHRNLCEDFVHIRELGVEEIGVCADIEVEPGAEIEQILAVMFQQLRVHISPPIPFYTIDELRAKGKTTDQIFEGPQLDHGFIDDDEFQAIQRRCEIRTSDVIRILMAVPGVIAVKRISLLSFIDGDGGGDGGAGAEAEPVIEDWVLTLRTEGRVPEFAPLRSKIVFFKNGLPYFPNAAHVEGLVRELRATQRRSRLRGHQRDLPVPAGEFRDPAVYYPIQNEMPATYKVGLVKVAASESPMRHAQARQLKGYLLLFEQVLANHLAQLAHVGDLFSWRANRTSTYFTQLVTDIFEVEALYHPALELEDARLQALEELVERPENASLRRTRFLDHLLGRFCESQDSYALLMAGIFGEEPARARVIDDKRALLRDYPRLSRTRGTAYDYRSPEAPDNVSGYKRRIHHLFGIGDVTRRNLAGHRLKVAKIDDEEFRFEFENPDGIVVFQSEPCRSASAVDTALDAALALGSDPAAYRFFRRRVEGGAPDELEADPRWHLIHECPGDDEPDVVGSFTLASEPSVRDEMIAYFQYIYGSEGLHVVENVLLRKRTPADPFLPIQLLDPDSCDCVEVREPYSFRMTVLLPSWPKRFQDLRFRRLLEDSLRLEAPAHVYVRICWISHDQMRRFEAVYLPWSLQLAALAKTPTLLEDPDLRNTYSERLAALIEILYQLDTVYPLALLHDCKATPNDEPAVTLDNTSLGTF